MSNVGEQIKRMAAYMDAAGKPDAPIRVNCTRAAVTRFIKPPAKGDPILCGRHPIITTEKRTVSDAEFERIAKEVAHGKRSGD